MNDTKPTRSTILFTIVAATVLIFALGLRMLRPISTSIDDPAIRALSDQARELSSFTPAALSRSLEGRSSAESRLWTSDKIKAWRDGVLRSWTIAEQPHQNNLYTSQRRFVVAQNAAPFQDWPDILAFYQSLTALPGARILSVEMAATPGAKAHFDRFQVLVAFITPKIESKSP